ncbi:hypothetical protein [Barrientosiimonas endolithica]|uniref:hypothetical protein n=1 Tax=Barrientosiimonas endolithica TaxID=1535208 RepID=UPI00259BDB9E|nr:hypothetical protein [Barrientosiimonas endolithica]
MCTEVPGMPVCSRTTAAGSVCDSMVASSASIQARDWKCSTTVRSWSTSVTDPTCS